MVNFLKRLRLKLAREFEFNKNPNFNIFLSNFYRNENKPCRFDATFPLGFSTKCKQKYQVHSVKTLNEEKTAIVDEKIYFPAACDCKVYSSKNLK